MQVYICKDSRTQMTSTMYLAYWHLLKKSVKKSIAKSIASGGNGWI